MKAVDIHPGAIVRFEKKLWQVADKSLSGHGKVSRTLHMKLRDLDGGAVKDQNFKGDDDLEVLEATVVTMEYLYPEDDFFVFMDTQSFEQHRFSRDSIGKQSVFLKENEKIEALVVEGKPQSIKFPATVRLKVESTPEGVRDVDKEATLENGMKILVPHFVNEDDSVVVDTEKFAYVERVTLKSMGGGGAVPGTGDSSKESD